MRERGMALAAVLLALVVVGGLVAGAFHLGHLEQRAGRNSLYVVQAAGAAEAGIAIVLGEWETVPELAALAVGERFTLAPVELAGRVGYSATVLRLSDALYLIQSSGTRQDAAGNALAQRAVAMVARSDGPAVAPLLQRSWAQGY